MAKNTQPDEADVVETTPDVAVGAEEGAQSCAVNTVQPRASSVDALIRKRVYAAIGIGFVPLPLVDFIGLSAVQLEMIHALAKVYGVEFKKDRVKSIISALGSGVLTTAGVPLAASLFKSIPVIGFPAGAATISIMGGASTYALGWVFDRHFRRGGTLAEFDTQEAKCYFKTKLDEGKAFVGKMKNKVTGAKGPAADAADAAPDAPAATPA